MTITVNLTSTSIAPNSPRYAYDLLVNGRFVKFAEISSANANDAAWMTNYFQKWAYRTYHVEDAAVELCYEAAA